MIPSSKLVFFFGSLFSSFAPIIGVPLSTDTTSRKIKLRGYGTGVTVTPASGLTWSKDGGAFSASAGTASDGDKIQVKVTSSSAYATAVDKTLTINGVVLHFIVTTMDAAWNDAGTWDDTKTWDDVRGMI